MIGLDLDVTARMERNTLLIRNIFATVFVCSGVVVFLAIFASGAAFSLFSVLGAGAGAGRAHDSIRSGLHSPGPLWNSRPWGRNAVATFLIWLWFLRFEIEFFG